MLEVKGGLRAGFSRGEGKSRVWLTTRCLCVHVFVLDRALDTHTLLIMLLTVWGAGDLGSGGVSQGQCLLLHPGTASL